MRTRLSLVLVCMATLACDATVTELDQIDSDLLAQVARISDGSLTPAEGVLVDMMRRSDADPLEPIIIPQLDSLFVLVTRDRSAEWAGEAVRATRQHDGLLTDAWHQIESGSASDGERRLVEARRVQSQTVARRLGRAGAMGYIAIVTESLERSKQRVGRNAPRRQRAMLDSALDLGDDARTALHAGRIAEAFDLASHAAGLANTLQAGPSRN